LITAGILASTANARDRKHDIDVRIKTQTPQLAASMKQSHYLIRNRQYGLAVDVLRKIIRTQPENASAYSAIAVAYDGLGRPDLARKNFEMALAYAPLEERHYRNLARHLDASGQKALARNIMHDLEIAQAQKAAANVIAVPVPDLDITALLTRLDRQALLVTSDSPSESPGAPLPEAPANKSAAIVSADLRISSKGTQAFEPIASGNGEDDPKSDGSRATIAGAGNSYSIPSTTIADVDESIAAIYKGLGIVISDPEPDAAFLDTVMGEVKSQISETAGDNAEDGNDTITNIESAANLGRWLEGLSERDAEVATNREFIERQKSPDGKAKRLQSKKAGFQLVRQSLGEVLLTANHVDWFVSNPVRTAGVNFNARQTQIKSSAKPDNESQYFAAIRSVFDSRDNRMVATSSDLLTDVALKQLDVAMAELAAKRHSRLPRIDQGPSPELRQIAVTLYERAETARRIPLQPAKQNMRVALFYRTETACAA